MASKLQMLLCLDVHKISGHFKKKM